MIYKIFVIVQTKLCYSKSFSKQGASDDDLVSGFLAAFSDFAQEITAGEIKSFKFKNYNYIYEYDKDINAMFVVIVDIDDLEEEVSQKVILLKTEFLNRFKKDLIDWNGNITIFRTFDDFVDTHLLIPPKVLITGIKGVGKTTIMNLFPGETIVDVDESMEEVIQKLIIVKGLSNVKKFILREIDLNDLILKPKFYSPYLNAVNIVCVVTSSTSNNLGKTKELFDRLKAFAKKPDFYIISSFQDLGPRAFDPEKIRDIFGVKTFPFSAIEKGSQLQIFRIMQEILKESFADKYLKTLKNILR